MRKMLFSKQTVIYLSSFLLLVGLMFFTGSVLAQDVRVNQGEIGFKIPNLGDILTFAIRAFFVIAGLSALFYLLLGAFAWVTSGGDKDAISGARDKIQAAVIGMILIVAVLAIIVTLETIVFRKKICLGISCPVSIPSLVSNCIPDPQSTDGNGCCAPGSVVVQESNVSSKLICCAADANDNGICDAGEGAP